MVILCLDVFDVCTSCYSYSVSVIINVSGIYDTSVYSYILIYPMIKFHKKIILLFAYKFSLYSETAF